MDNNNGNPTTKSNQQPQAPATMLQIIIQWDQVSRQMNVNYPQDLVLAYGMLEAAKDCIRKQMEQNQGKILLPGGVQVINRTVS